MNSQSILLLTAISLVAVSYGENVDRPPMRKAPTNEELILQLRKSEQAMADQPKVRPLSTTADPNVTQQPQDFISSSEILCFNGALTFVPKRAVLQLPKDLADRLLAKPGVRIQTWPDFFAANRGWITTVEVNKVQAQGKQALPEETQLQITKCGKLVIATFNGNPISVHPVRVPETPSSISTTPASTPISHKP